VAALAETENPSDPQENQTSERLECFVSFFTPPGKKIDVFNNSKNYSGIDTSFFW